MPNAIGNFFMKLMVNSPLHAMLGDRFAVITVTGCKTGKRYSTPINVLKDGDGFFIVSLKNRTWWRNLRRGRSAQLRISGKRLRVRSEVFEEHDEVTDALMRYFQKAPGDAKHFGVRLARDERPIREDVERAAGERVMIRLICEPTNTSIPV
jgi:deazaflavin-dependent oxidoreductase (nitroreductase family)